MTSPPEIKDAPGHVVRRRGTGWEVRWQPRTDLRKRGCPLKQQRLWFGLFGTEPTTPERALISDTCHALQNEMLVWGRVGTEQEGETVTTFDGTVAGLIDAYMTDRDSGYQKLRYHTRNFYARVCMMVKDEFGDKSVADIKTRDILHWNETIATSGRVAMSHALVGMLRTLMSYGMTILESDDCAKVSGRLSSMRFKMAKPRESFLTADMANLIRAGAHKANLPSIALAQAFQFDLMLRQKDVIGERVPMDERGVYEYHYGGFKWMRGLTWQEIGDDMILRHVTSKRQKLIEVDLRRAPMVVEELTKQYGYDGTRASLPTSGPIIMFEKFGVPWHPDKFRIEWRKIANDAGIPKSVRNMDSRAGAITEATKAGAPLESIRHAATHSDIAMTQRYARGAADKTAEVMDLRAAHRNKTGTG